MKRFVGFKREDHNPFKAALCGASAAIAHDFFMVPFDLVKQRMQLGHYSSVSNCIKSILKLEGVRGLFVSYPTTLLMNIPYGCVMVPVNESIKELLSPNQQFSFSSSIIAGAIAGMSAAAITNPLDVIKTRLQTRGLRDVVVSTTCVYDGTITSTEKLSKLNQVNVKSSIGFLNEAKTLLAEEGFRGLMKGVVPRMITHAPAVAISWTVYEAMKDMLNSISKFD